MTVQEFQQLKTGDRVYVPFIDKVAYLPVGNRIIGSDCFERFTYRRFTVKDVAVHDYDPDGTKWGWASGRVSHMVKFGLDGLSDNEMHNFVTTYCDNFPVICKGLTEDTEKYQKGLYFEAFTVNNSPLAQHMAIELLSRRKADCIKNIRMLHKRSLEYIDKAIQRYRINKASVKDFLDGKQ
jgi:hypothetical protein